MRGIFKIPRIIFMTMNPSPGHPSLLLVIPVFPQAACEILPAQPSLLPSPA